MVVVPRGRGKLGGGGSVGPELVVVDTAVPLRVGGETIEGGMVVGATTEGTVVGTVESDGGWPEMEPEATRWGMLGRAPSELSQS